MYETDYTIARNIFLAHLNWKQWALLINCHLSSVYLSICLSFHIFNFFSRTSGPISTKLGTKHSWVKKTQCLEIKNHSILVKEIRIFFFLNQCYGLIILLRNHWMELFLRPRWAMWPRGVFVILYEANRFNFMCSSFFLFTEVLNCLRLMNIIEKQNGLWLEFHNLAPYNKYNQFKTTVILQWKQLHCTYHIIIHVLWL